MTEVIDGWTIEGNRAWRISDGLPGTLIERTADEIRARNLLWRAAGLLGELESRRLGPLRPTWHCSAATAALIAKVSGLDLPDPQPGPMVTMYGLPVVIDESPELHIEIPLPARNDR